MRKVLRSDRGRLKDGETTVEVRFINEDGETECWLVEDFVSEHIRERVKASYIDDGVDARIANQAESINRLLDHVKYHCPRFADRSGNCGYQWRGK
jgi:hypothetical protein